MRKISVVIAAAILLSVWFLPGKANAVEETPEELTDLYARSAVLMDAESGRVLFGKEADAVRPMASTTKIMTCILALEKGNPEDSVKVSELAARQPKVNLGMRASETYRLEDLLYSLMLESHNDTAVAVAEHIGGSVEEFARMMNEKAREIGCRHTHYITPNGLDAQDEEGVHSTTAADLASVMKYCIRDSEKKEEFLKITQTQTHTFSDETGARSFTCSNHNAFLGMMDGALSGKTGFTGDAGYCYVGALRRDDRTFIVALLACGWPNNKSYKWSDTKKLMNYGLEHYHYQNVWQETELSDLPVTKGIPDGGALSGKSTVGLEIRDAPEKWNVLLSDSETVTRSVEVEEQEHAPVKKGKEAGRILYRLNGEIIGEWKIVTSHFAGLRSWKWCWKNIADRFFLQF